MTDETTPELPAGNMALRSAVFEVLRSHDVSEQCFAEVASITHHALTRPTMPSEVTEALDMCRNLIQEAKGHEGPNGGFVTNHLDDAENWLDKIEDSLAHNAAQPDADADAGVMELLAEALPWVQEANPDLETRILAALKGAAK